MSIENIKSAVPDYAKDLRINLGNVLNEEHSPGLTKKQIFGIALSTVFALKNDFLIKNIQAESGSLFAEEELKGIKTAVSLMGMNNVYYRSLHLAEEEELSKRPAGLRMTMMNSHGLPQKDFEMYSLAVSCLSGCGLCIKSHSAKLKKEGLSFSGIQSIFKISAVIKGVSQSLY